MNDENCMITILEGETYLPDIGMSLIDIVIQEFS